MQEVVVQKMVVEDVRGVLLKKLAIPKKMLIKNLGNG